MKTAIISPSGQFYGSEQTLFSFLKETKNTYDVFVNTNTNQFIEILHKHSRHKIFPFSNTKLLYIKLFIYLIYGKYNTLYINEGGHIRYIKILASIFPHKQFVVHIRLVDDTFSKRIKTKYSNIHLISVSKYIADLIKTNTDINTDIISSPVRAVQKNIVWRNINHQKVKIGIIGRVTHTKGINDIVSFCNYCENKSIKNIELHLFGDIEDNFVSVKKFIEESKNYKFIKTIFHGYTIDKDQIFKSVDLVLHFNKFESLGVIFFEALNYGKPFIGFNAGGIGDIASNLQIQDLMIKKSTNWQNELLELIHNLNNNIENYKEAQINILKRYSVQNYCKLIESKIISSTKLAIIHFLPLEIYPPATNFINFLSTFQQELSIHVYSIHNSKKRKIFNNALTSINRYNSPSIANISFPKRIIRHFAFNIDVLFSLIKFKPDKILYYESFSALPAFLYSFLIKRKIQIFIHCHEYLAPTWYKNYSPIIRFYHFLERKFLYKKAQWISHTNEKRIDLFKNDFPFISGSNLKIIPNYPPQKWSNINSSCRNKTDKIIRFVYIGTLSLEYTYIEEFCIWIKNQDNMQLDIYAFNLDNSTLESIKLHASKNIHFHQEGIEYENIPNILHQYDIGLILYKALTLNFKYNATNKLFEYLACNLDVWFPEEMLGCYEYITHETWPQVKKIDFKNLIGIKSEITNRKKLTFKQQNYWCEEAFQPLAQKLVK